MNASPSRITGLSLILTLAAAAPAARAQAAAENNGENVITLQAFDVTADAAHGYVASEAVTGTRIASKIADLPFAVTVVTADFLRDFAASDMKEQLGFVAGISPSEVTGQLQLRGFAAPTTMVDGFRRINLVAVSDLDRIEIIKGPAGSIYGAIQPGGAVNFITRQPTTVPTQEVQILGGSDSQYRGSIYSSGPLTKNKKFFYQVDVSNQFNKYMQEFASKHNAYASGKLVFKPDANTSLTLGVSHSELYEHPFVQALTVTEKRISPWAGNGVTVSQYYGMALTDLLNYNYAGPESYTHNRLTQGTIDLQHRFTDAWSMRFGANAYTNPQNDQTVGSGAYYPYGTGNVTTDANGVIQQAFAPVVKDQPQADWKPQRGGGAQLDNTFDFRTGPVRHKFLITADYNELTQKTVTLVPTLGTTSQATDYYALYSPYSSAGAPYYAPQSTWNTGLLGYGWNTVLYGQNPALYNGVVTDNYTAAADYGIFASEHAIMLDDRLHFIVGGRWDRVQNQVRNYNFPQGGGATSLLVEPTAYQTFNYNTSAMTYEAGASFTVTRGLSVYANKSTAFNPQPQIDSVTGLPLPNNKSDGYEYGLKASFLENRLNLTVDRFLINQYNLAQSQTDPVSGLKDTILTGQQQAKGYEMEFNFQANNDWIILGDWGYTQATILNAYALTFLDGLPVRRVPRDNVGLATRYRISHGRLAGLFFVGSAKYYSKSLVNLGSGKSLVPGPAGATSNSTVSMYYVPSTNLTYTSGTDPKAAGELKITATPVINAPFPGNGQLPYPNLPAGALINYPVGANGAPLAAAPSAGAGVYSGEPGGVFVDDGRQNNFNAPYATFGIGTGYTWKTGRFSHEFQINVQNMLNRAYTYGSGTPGAPFQVISTYSLKF